jgi:hypothetical protein
VIFRPPLFAVAASSVWLSRSPLWLDGISRNKNDFVYGSL